MVSLNLHSFKNIFTLFSGNFVAQAITFLAGLLLARFYTPAEFGILGIFLAISNILIPISCLGYEAAIVTTKSLKEAFTVGVLCFSICFILSILIVLPIIFFKTEIVQLLNMSNIYPWIYLIPISVLLGGTFNILNYFNTKLQEYKQIAVSHVIKNLTCAGIQILGSFLRTGPGMLIIGQASINIFGNIKLFKNFWKSKHKVTIESIKNSIKKYSKFPKYYLVGSFVNNISLNITNILIKRLFSATDVGYYSYAYKYISFPLSLISTSIGQIYYQEISTEINKDSNSNIFRVFKETLIKLLIIGLPIFLAIYFLIKPGFVVLFGQEWAMAGVVGQILTPLFFIRFIVSPLSMSLLACGKQQYLLIIQTLLLILTIIPYIIVNLIGGELFNYLYYVVGFMGSGYIIFLFVIILVVLKKI